MFSKPSNRLTEKFLSPLGNTVVKYFLVNRKKNYFYAIQLGLLNLNTVKRHSSVSEMRDFMKQELI